MCSPTGEARCAPVFWGSAFSCPILCLEVFWLEKGGSSHRVSPEIANGTIPLTYDREEEPDKKIFQEKLVVG